VSATGALLFVRAQSTLPARPHTVAVAPDGKYLYIGSNDDSKILAARIGADGSPQAFVAVGIWQSGEPEPFVFRPTQAPIAKFNASPTDKPLVMQFNPTSTTLTSNSNTLDWSYGDGKTFKGTTRATNDHKYAKPGVYNVTLAAASDGCSTAFISTGRSAICNGAPTATTTVKVDTPPWITKLKVSKKTFKLGKSTKVSYKVTEKAYVDMFAQRPAKGRMQSGECRKPSAKNKKGKKCTRWARATQTIPSSGRRTSGSFKFTGRVAASKIGPGKYRLIARAFDKAGGKSPPVTVKFKIKR
jgi:hypothetical protein